MTSTVTYRISLVEPALLTEETGEPSSAVSQSFLPGGALRGALIARYLARPGAPADAAIDGDFRRLFLGGAVRCLNGYLVGQGIRTLPVPLSWHRAKDEALKLYDLARNRPEGDQTWQGAGGSFWSPRLGASNVALKVPDRHVAAHNFRSRRFGRARPGDGAVFRYDALASHQTFEAAVVCDAPADAETLRTLLSEELCLRLGGSDTAGYGAARIEEVSGVLDKWCETQHHKYEGEAPDQELEEDDDSGEELYPAGESSPIVALPEGPIPTRFALTLLSDAMVRDNHGQWALSAHAVARELEAHLGLTPESLSVSDAFFRGHMVGGFNRTWGLPLPQAQALQMGSVFVFEGLPLPESARDRLESEGIGERRSEGFGRVAVDWYFGGEMGEDSSKALHSGFLGVLPAGAAHAWADTIAGRLFGRRLEERLQEAAGKDILFKPPHGAQIGRLRDVINDERRRAAPDLGRIKTYLTGVGNRASAAQQFRDARVNGKRMDEWLADWLNEGASAPNWEQIAVKPEDFRRVGGIPPDVGNSWPGAVLRYLDAVLARAAKQVRHREESE